MNTKAFHPDDLKFMDGADQAGQFVATFARLNVIDRDGDVTLPGAFKNGQQVRIAAWGHNWGTLPVGNGTVYADDQKAWVAGQFFLDTLGGQETYKTVKNLGALQEWSYGFDITEWSGGEFNGQQVRFLKGLDTFEVSPVLLGAGIGTQTDMIKAAKDAVADPVAVFLAALKTLDTDDPTALGAALSYAEHMTLVAALGDVLVRESKAVEGRSAERLEIRAKEGRRFSQATQDALSGHATALHEIAGSMEKMLNEGDDVAAPDNRPEGDVVEQPKPNPKKDGTAAWVEALKADLYVRHGVTV